MNVADKVMCVIVGAFVVVAASWAAAHVGNGVISYAVEEQDAYEVPYPRRGCRRCRPQAMDIPFLDRNGNDRLLTQDRDTGYYSVVDCSRDPVRMSVSAALARVRETNENILQSGYVFCADNPRTARRH